MTNRYHVRKWLNRKSHYGGGHIIACVSKSVVPKGRKALRKYYNTSDCYVDISDCNRKIHLDFTSWDSAEGKNHLHKLDGLIDTLTDFRKALIEEYAVLDKIRKLVKALPPEKKS